MVTETVYKCGHTLTVGGTCADPAGLLDPDRKSEVCESFCAMCTETPIMRFFVSKHLPPYLRNVSEKIAEAALFMEMNLARDAEKSAGLRKLLEAKDCFVRAALNGKKGG